MLKLAILAVLDEAPRIGHQVRRRLDEIAGMSLAANQGQVYATLARLARAGLIERVGSGDGAPGSLGGRHPRQAYAIRASGRALLEAALAAPLRSQHRHDDILPRLFFLVRSGDSRGVASIVARRRSAIAAAARRIEATSSPSAAVESFSTGDERASVLREIARKAAASHLETEAAWLDRVVESIGSEAARCRLRVRKSAVDGARDLDGARGAR